jgi:putative endonuclease
MTVFYVYVLWSPSAGRSYVGSTGDLDDRLHRHNAGESQSTKHGVPWRLMHSESFPSRSQAVLRERHLKTGRGREELKAWLPAVG